MSRLKIEHWPIDKILPYKRNARVHSPSQKAKIKASIEQFGFVNPCLVDADGVLIAGHGRAESAQELGLKTIPVIKLGHLSEAQAKALRLADNSIQLESSWSVDLLESELNLLKSMDFDLAPLGLDSISLPDDLDSDEIIQAAPRAQRNKKTIFVSVLNQDVEKATKIIKTALDKGKINHNL